MNRGEPETVAFAIASRLAEAGVTHAFGYPGGETLDLLEAFRAAGISFVLTRHEAAAAFAAGAYGELTGRPGVCLATLGPGATNLVSGIAAAYLERAPVLAFTAQLPRSRRETTTHQRIDLNALFRPVTKGSFLLDPSDARRTLEKGIQLATAARPGPVHFEVPSDVPRAVCGDAIGRGFFAGLTRAKGAAAAPAPCAYDAATRVVAAAARPVMLIGVGARTAGQAAVTALAEAGGLPVVVTPKAKGLIPESHPLFGGVVEMLGKKHVLDWLAAADAFVYVGFDPVELDMLWEYQAPGVLIDEIPDQDAYYRVDAELTGPIGPVMSGWLERVTSAGGAGEPYAVLHGARGHNYGATAAGGLREALHRCLSVEASPGLLSPREVVEAVRCAAGSPDAMVTTDVGAHKMAVGQLWRTDSAGCFLMSNGQSSMGYGLPAAITAKLIHPGREVVAMIGDGGLGMYLGELETVKRLGLNLPVVVFADRQLSLIAMGQERRGYPRQAVDFGNPDFSLLARGMGGHGAVAASPEQLRDEVRAAFGRRTFSLIAVPVDDSLYRV